jgi:hypothetical protein
MPTNPEHSPSSEATSQARPMHQDGRTAVDTFDADEFLYRRYAMVHFADGQVLPQTISFPKPSFNRSKFSRPEDVLHIDCCDGKGLPGWGFLRAGRPTFASLRNQGINVSSHYTRSTYRNRPATHIQNCGAHLQLRKTQNQRKARRRSFASCCQGN